MMIPLPPLSIAVRHRPMALLARRIGSALAAATLFVLAGPAARATTAHAWYGADYSVTVVEPQSNIFNNSIAFEGNVLNGGTYYSSTQLGGYFIGAAGQESGHETHFDDQHLTVTFTADAGHAFNSVNLGFGPWSWMSSNDASSGYTSSGSWSVSSGSYTGTSSYYYTDYAYREYRWDAAGNSGSFSYYDGWPRSGGSHGGRGLMDGVILLPYVTEFTVTLDMAGWIRSNSWYSINYFGVDVGVVEALDTPPAGVPDAGSTAGLMLLALAGLGSARKRARSARA